MAAEPQRIYPASVDQEAGERPRTPPATAPLMPSGSALSEKGDPRSSYPPQTRTFPVAYSRPPKRRRGCFCRCICWTLCMVIALVVAVAITVGVLYLIYRPKIPKYSVDDLSISNFTVGSNLTVSAAFVVTVTTKNPNDKIGIYYVSGSHLSVLYEDLTLCKGKLPVFYQGHHNTTVLDVVMTGETQFNSELLSELQAAQQSSAVPLKFRGTVPVRVKFGALKLFKVKFLVRCDVVVTSLSTNLDINIKTSDCKFKFRL